MPWQLPVFASGSCGSKWESSLRPAEILARGSDLSGALDLRTHAAILDPTSVEILETSWPYAGSQRLAQLLDLAFMKTLDDGQRWALDPSGSCGSKR